MIQIKLSRWIADGEVERQDWKDLISSLALAGYEVYADKEFVVFEIGSDDRFIDDSKVQMLNIDDFDHQDILEAMKTAQIKDGCTNENQAKEIEKYIKSILKGHRHKIA